MGVWWRSQSTKGHPVKNDPFLAWPPISAPLFKGNHYGSTCGCHLGAYILVLVSSTTTIILSFQPRCDRAVLSVHLLSSRTRCERGPRTLQLCLQWIGFQSAQRGVKGEGDGPKSAPQNTPSKRSLPGFKYNLYCLRGPSLHFPSPLPNRYH